MKGYSVYNNIKKQLKKIAIRLGFFSTPSFMIIGVEKGGTSGLFETLNNHPYLCGSATKETNYFSIDSNFPNPKYRDYYLYFSILSKNTKAFEASPAYLYNLNAAKRIHEFDPDMKFIVSLRNPATRVLSAWSMFRNFPTDQYQYEERPFDVMVEEEIHKFYNNQKESPQGYLSKGLYFDQLMNYFNHFDRENVLIFENKELIKTPEQSLQKVFQFLDLNDPDLTMKISFSSKHPQKEKRYAKELELLKEFYKPYNNQLYKLLKKDFEWNKEVL